MGTFKHWHSIWEDVLKLENSLNSDSFLRQDILCPITYELQTVGLFATSYYNINLLPYHYHSYLENFDIQKLGNISTSGILMTIEYLSVHKEFRKNILNLSLGNVLLGLAMKVLKNGPADTVLGTARTKNHVHEMSYQFGFQSIGQMSKFGHPCELVFNTDKNIKSHSDPLTNHTIERLWKEKSISNTTENFINKSAS